MKNWALHKQNLLVYRVANMNVSVGKNVSFCFGFARPCTREKYSVQNSRGSYSNLLTEVNVFLLTSHGISFPAVVLASVLPR